MAIGTISLKNLPYHTEFSLVHEVGPGESPRQFWKRPSPILEIEPDTADGPTEPRERHAPAGHELATDLHGFVHVFSETIQVYA